MDTYHVVLYIHFLALFVGIGAAGVLVTCLFQLRAAGTLADALPWGKVAEKTARVFPIAILGLFGSGAYMTSDLWTWSTGWIEVSIAVLVILAIQGPVVGGLMGKKLEHTLRENGPGPLGDAARRMIRHPVLWGNEFTAIAIVLATVWNMTQKPGTTSAIVAVVVAYVVAAGLALAITKVPADEVPATELST